MSQAQQVRFQCSGCGKSYGWKPELAGKRVKCKCGAVMTVPQAKEPPAAVQEEDPLYDLVPDEAPASPRSAVAPALQGMRCPSCKATMASGAVICVACGFNLKTGKKMGTAVNSAGSAPVAAASGLPGGMIVPPRMGPKSMQKSSMGSDEDSRKKMVMLGVGAVVLVGLLVGGVMVMKQMSPSQQLNAYDKEVQSDLNDMRALPIDEWMEYPRLQLAGGHDKKKARQLADSMLKAGATQVLLPQSPGSMWLVAVLPDDPVKRKAVFNFVNKYHTDADRSARLLEDDGTQKYLQLRFHMFST